MIITEKIKQELIKVSRPLYIFLGQEEYDQLLSESPKELYYTSEGDVIFDIVEVIEVNKKSFFLIAG